MLSKKPRLAIVIGSGGLKCAAAIGVMQALEEENIEMDIVVGCSGGSVFGAAIAMGFSSDKINALRGQTWTSDVTRKINIRSILKIFFPKLIGFDDKVSIFNDDVMTGNIQKAFGKTTTFQNTKIPFYCVATDFDTGKPVVLSEGGLAKAIRISSGIPLVFQPIELDGKLLIDGGLSNPLPIDVAMKAGAEIIIAVGFETPLLPSVSSAKNYASQMFNILINQLMYKQFSYYNLAHHSEIIPIIPTFDEQIKIDEVGKVPYIIEQGYKETKKHIGYLKKMLAMPTN